MSNKKPIKSVKNQSSAMVSAGNTGALMAFSKLFLKTISGINRPAIAACFPTKLGEVCMLDLGANIESDKMTDIVNLKNIEHTKIGEDILIKGWSTAIKRTLIN